MYKILIAGLLFLSFSANVYAADKWEYKIDKAGFFTANGTLPLLNKSGKNSWELVSTISQGGGVVFFVYKRPKK